MRKLAFASCLDNVKRTPSSLSDGWRVVLRGCEAVPFGFATRIHMARRGVAQILSHLSATAARRL